MAGEPELGPVLFTGLARQKCSRARKGVGRRLAHARQRRAGTMAQVTMTAAE